MIVKQSQATMAKVDKPIGGEGYMDFLSIIGDGNRLKGSRFSMAAEITLPVGASVGYHDHPADEEIYLILSGTGSYVENDRSEHPVGKGDLTLCPTGEGHALINNGKEPLVFLAFIAE
ncbi:MAG: cupin domain-containing protein [Deltaproteobacteria bacterium]|nr:cupin domain-containing protein [Deltaproteobacteria bacterium]